MERRIKVTGIPRPAPGLRLYVQALIELARQLQAEEEARKRGEQAALSAGRERVSRSGYAAGPSQPVEVAYEAIPHHLG